MSDATQNPFAKTEEKPAPLHAPLSLLDAFAADAQTRRDARASGRNLGPVTGFPSLDGYSDGATLRPGYLGCLEVGLHVVMGSAGGGKTAFCLQIAMDCGTPAMFVSGEVSVIEMMCRITANRTETYLDKFKSGQLTGDAVRDLGKRALSGLGMLGLMDATQAPAPPEHLIRCMETVRNAAAASEAKGPGALLVIDSLNSWAARTYPDLGEYDALRQGFSALETLAHGMKIPILLIAEQTLNALRESSKDGSGGGLHSGAGHRRVAFAPETVFTLSRSKESKEDGNGWREVSVNIEKNRHGRCGSFTLQWSGGFQKYREAK